MAFRELSHADLGMRVLLKNSEGEFLKDSGEWTKDENQARTFVSSLEAMRYCQAHKQQGLILTLSFPDRESDIELPNLCK